MIPKHAITIWQADREIHADLKGHKITVPATGAGIRKLLIILEHRTAQSKIGERGDPTQHHIDKAKFALPDYSEAMVRRVSMSMTPERMAIIAAAAKKAGLT